MGRLTALGLSDSYEIESFHNGEYSRYIVYIDPADEKIKYSKIKPREGVVHKQSGLNVSIPIDEDDIQKVVEAAKDVLPRSIRFSEDGEPLNIWEVKSRHRIEPDKISKLLGSETTYIAKHEKPKTRKALPERRDGVLIGGEFFPLDLSRSVFGNSEGRTDTGKKLNALMYLLPNHDIIFSAPIKSFSIKPSREGLNYDDPATDSNLAFYIDSAYAGIEKYFSDISQAKSAGDLLAKLELLRDTFDGVFSTSPTPLTWASTAKFFNSDPLCVVKSIFKCMHNCFDNDTDFNKLYSFVIDNKHIVEQPDRNDAGKLLKGLVNKTYSKYKNRDYKRAEAINDIIKAVCGRAVRRFVGGTNVEFLGRIPSTIAVIGADGKKLPNKALDKTEILESKNTVINDMPGSAILSAKIASEIGIEFDYWITAASDGNLPKSTQAIFPNAQKLSSTAHGNDYFAAICKYNPSYIFDFLMSKGFHILNNTISATMLKNSTINNLVLVKSIKERSVLESARKFDFYTPPEGTVFLYIDDDADIEAITNTFPHASVNNMETLEFQRIAESHNKIKAEIRAKSRAEIEARQVENDKSIKKQKAAAGRDAVRGKLVSISAQGATSKTDLDLSAHAKDNTILLMRDHLDSEFVSNFTKLLSYLAVKSGEARKFCYLNSESNFKTYIPLAERDGVFRNFIVVQNRAKVSNLIISEMKKAGGDAFAEFQDDLTSSANRLESDKVRSTNTISRNIQELGELIPILADSSINKESLKSISDKLEYVTGQMSTNEAPIFNKYISDLFTNVRAKSTPLKDSINSIFDDLFSIAQQISKEMKNSPRPSTLLLSRQEQKLISGLRSISDHNKPSVAPHLILWLASWAQYDTFVRVSGKINKNQDKKPHTASDDLMGRPCK